eukprot:7377268-Prymnesium_polylepis.1
MRTAVPASRPALMPANHSFCSSPSLAAIRIAGSGRGTSNGSACRTRAARLKAVARSGTGATKLWAMRSASACRAVSRRMQRTQIFIRANGDL